MVKVLIADENVEQATQCCQYLSSHDHMLKLTSANTGVETLEKYNTLKTDILVLNSHFKDVKSTEIVDRLSSTRSERKKINIILTLNSKKEKLDFVNVVKIYSFFDKPLDLKSISNTIKQICSENKYDEFNEDYLYKLLFSLRIIVGSYQSNILVEAIKECYEYPKLLGNFDSLLSLLSYKHNEMDTESIRNAIRSSLNDLNKYRNKIQDHPILKMFEPDRNISPKAFLEVVVSYMHSQKNQEIFY